MDKLGVRSVDDLKRNKEGYSDPTAYHGMRAVIQSETEADKLAFQVIGIVKFILRSFGFELIERIKIRDTKSGREYR